MTIELLTILCGMMGIFFIGMGFYCIYRIILKKKDKKIIQEAVARHKALHPNETITPERRGEKL